jgi:hypothetical protein
MLKKIMLLLCLGMTTAALAQPNPDTLWTRVAGGSNIDQIASVDTTIDGGFVAAGETRSFGAGGLDGYVLKYSGSGALEWSKAIGSSATDRFYDIQQTSDGGYIGTGASGRVNATGDAWLVKMNSSGDSVWTRYIGTSGAIETGYGVQQTADGGYIMCGTRNSGGSQLWLVRFNSNGDTLWTRRIGGTGSEVGHDIIIESDGGFVVTGYTSSYGAGAESVYIVRTNSTGDTLWTRTYGGALTDVGYCIRPDNAGGYYVSGYTNSFGFSSSSDPYVLRLTSDGDTLWTRYAGIGGGPAWSVMPTTDGGCYLAGWVLSGSSIEYYLSRWTPNGVPTWTRTYGGGAQDYCFDAEQTRDHGFILGGYSLSFSSSADAYFVKTGAEGSIAVLAPNGLEEWKLLMPYTVSWYSSPTVANVKIELNRNYPGGAWETLVASTPDDGAEVLAVGQPPAPAARIRVTQLPAGGSDISNGDFLISSSNGQVALIELPNQTTPITSWAMGNIECGLVAQRVFHVKNFGSDTVIVFQPRSLSVPGFTVAETCADSFMVAPGAYASCNIFVSYNNGIDGSWADTVRFRTNASNAVNNDFAFPLSVTQFSVPAAPDSVVLVGMEDSVKVVWGAVRYSTIGCLLNPPVPGYVVYAARNPMDTFVAIDTLSDTFFVAPAMIDTVRMFRITAIDPTP